jgi:hypothetical protein
VKDLGLDGLVPICPHVSQLLGLPHDPSAAKYPLFVNNIVVIGLCLRLFVDAVPTTNIIKIIESGNNWKATEEDHDHFYVVY